MSIHIDQFRTEWTNLCNDARPGDQSQPAYRTAVAGLLSRVRESGSQARDLTIRGELQDLAREMADYIFRTTGEFPSAAIAPLAWTVPVFRVDISRIVHSAPAELFGREAEVELLSSAWKQVVQGDPERPHILTLVGQGGEGKTSLVAKWAAALAHQGWPGCEIAFAWSFYSQGTREQAASTADSFLADALAFFGDVGMVTGGHSSIEKGRQLARLVGERRALLILDGLEPLQYAPTSTKFGEVKDQGLAVLLKGLAASNCGLCVVTTRYSIVDLRTFSQATAREVHLSRLSEAAAVALLRALGVRGNYHEFERLIEDVKGHPLTLNLLGSFLRDAHAGDIRKRDLVNLAEADSEEQGGHAFRVMDAEMRAFECEGEKGKGAVAILRLLGLFDRPATTDRLNILLKAPAVSGLTDVLVGMSDSQLNMAISRLEDARLVTVSRGSSGITLSLDTHPLLREYFTQRMAGERAEAWRAAHRLLYEHLCANTQEGDQPTVETLQPLYEAVAHGCHAGLHQDVFDNVYRGRIHRGEQYYSIRRLGAVGSDLRAIACFFDQPWSVVSPLLKEADRAWLLNDAAFNLRALIRFVEALEPMRVGLDNYREHKGWIGAAKVAGNLSELKLALGDVAGAVGDSEQAVDYADRCGDQFQRMRERATLADALHQYGRVADAEAHFRDAEMMNVEWRPILHGLQGFLYCDLLLSVAERCAWQEFLGSSEIPLRPGLLESCRASSGRGAVTLAWAEGQDLVLYKALDHLTLGRAALYEAILDGSHSDFRIPHSELNLSVSSFRRAGAQHWIGTALLTRAWLRFLTGARVGLESAQSDLDEAWEMAERGPMRLLLADIHLHRARLFFRENSYPWNQSSNGTWRSPADDLAAAEKLIIQCHYHRRDEELANAKLAIPNGMV